MNKQKQILWEEFFKRIEETPFEQFEQELRKARESMMEFWSTAQMPFTEENWDEIFIRRSSVSWNDLSEFTLIGDDDLPFSVSWLQAATYLNRREAPPELENEGMDSYVQFPVAANYDYGLAA
ncbi:MAG: hypothetical protein WBQ23_10140 [Bacteroidota bacterium]